MVLYRQLRTWLFLVPLIGIATIVMGTLSIVITFFDRTGNRAHEAARSWSRLLLWAGSVRVVTEGMEKLDPRASYVLVANHSSYYDTPAILANVPLQFRFFAKQGLFQIPFLGTHLKRAGHFPVVRSDPRASLKTMLEGARQLNEKHISVLVFPEGGRSEKSLREFKEGASHMAIKAGAPLVPVGIVGARQVLPMHGSRVNAGTIRIKVGDPIPTSGMSSRERGALTQRAMREIAEMVGEPLPAASAAAVL